MTDPDPPRLFLGVYTLQHPSAGSDARADIVPWAIPARWWFWVPDRRRLSAVVDLVARNRNDPGSVRGLVKRRLGERDVVLDTNEVPVRVGDRLYFLAVPSTSDLTARSVWAIPHLGRVTATRDDQHLGYGIPTQSNTWDFCRPRVWIKAVDLVGAGDHLDALFDAADLAGL